LPAVPYINVICLSCGSAQTVKTEQTVRCAVCGAEICAAGRKIDGAAPAPDVQYAPRPNLPVRGIAPQAPLSVRTDSEDMITAGAGDLTPPHLLQYRKNWRIWRGFLAGWFLAYTVLTAVLICFGNEFPALVLLFAGAAALGAAFPVHPKFPGLPVLQKFSAFVLLLVCGGFSGMLLGHLFHDVIQSLL